MYHLSIKIITRGTGKSAVAAAAYRAGEAIKNERDGLLHDYTRKQGISHTEILLPENAPAEYKSRSVLWNAVEQIERAKNSQLSREIEIALPVELNLLQSKSLVREYVKKNFVDCGMCADIAIHGMGTHNPHAHIMLTMRPFTEEKSWGTKQRKEYILDQQGEKIYDPKKKQYKCKSVPSTDWNEQTKAEDWRAAWAETANKYLAHLNHTKRLDHRSYKRQGKSQIPTIHLGAAAHQMEQRGIRTDRGNINREIEISNRKLRQLEERINELQGWIAEEMAKPEPPTAPPQPAEPPQPQPPTFADVIADILSRQGQIVTNKAHATQILNFLKSKQIADYKSLEKYLQNLMGKQRTTGKKLTPIRQRMTELTDHVQEYETYKKRKAQHDQYQQDYKAQKPWKKKAFQQEHGYIVGLYETSKDYMDCVRNSKNQIPINAWKKEYTDLSLELRELDRAYQNLKAEVDSVSKIRVTVYDILRKEQQRGQPIRAQGLER